MSYKIPWSKLCCMMPLERIARLVWTQIPEDGRIEAEGIWPLLRIRTDQEVDLHVVDGRLWVEEGV